MSKERTRNNHGNTAESAVVHKYYKEISSGEESLIVWGNWNKGKVDKRSPSMIKFEIKDKKFNEPQFDLNAEDEVEERVK
jgi:hypothetical protein